MARPAPSSLFLNSCAVAPSTLSTYLRAVNFFLSWVRARYRWPSRSRPSGDRLLSTSAADLYGFDVLLHSFVDYCYRHGLSLSLATNVRHGVAFFVPRCRDLPLTDQALRGWRRLQPSVSYPPLSWELSVVIAAQLLFRSRLPRFALGVLLAFDCYLRLSELVSLRKCDFSFALAGSSLKVGIRLRDTKTGPNKFVTVSRLAISRLLKSFLAKLQPEDLVFPFSGDVFRARFHSALDSLGLRAFGFVPHSLRHGGATHDYACGESLDYVMGRGRWAVSKSARTYIQSGRALLIASRVPKRYSELGARLSADLVRLFSSALSQ